MQTIFKKSFLKSLQKITDQKTRDNVVAIIAEVEHASRITDVQNTKKLKGYKQFYRIRSGSYRIGIQLEDDTVTFAAFDHRKDIYKHFP